MKIVKTRGPYRVEYVCALPSCKKSIKRFNYIKPKRADVLRNKHFCDMGCYNLFRKSQVYKVIHKPKKIKFYDKLQKKTDAFERYLARQNILDIE